MNTRATGATSGPENSPADQPITVQVTRRVRVHDAAAVDAWVSRGQAVMIDFPGYLGSGLVRSSRTSDTWRMLYRFADRESLQRWHDSAERAAWIREMADAVAQEDFEHRTGIEGWFDAPEQAPLPSPPRWKQMVVIFTGFFPMSLLVNAVLAGVLPADTPLVLRVLAAIIPVMPVMVYLVLPGLTRLFRPWLLAGNDRR
ncbi:antibiotic biosynthesis monooxygenase (ABM) superfamily enzyme [Micrococcus cohnii]|uniref:Antibiotic biosynthesis monooxygenase (ABM) superfamily enzyme n=1 Tax=Micrococcus cohnii TaxID=993416 RepID=A0A7W7M377_9MICC|nr:antibiotic biosynthesis monooxygenase (ABM) superfamily enzyme [Micrococcus cohnii]